MQILTATNGFGMTTIPAHHSVGSNIGDIMPKGLHAGQLLLHLLPQWNGYIARAVQGKWFCIGLELYGIVVALEGA